MLIAIDIDDTLVDFMTSLIEFHNEKYNTSLTRDQFSSYNFWEIWGGTMEEARQKVKDYRETHYYNNLQPVLGVVESINFLKKKHGLIIITSRSITKGTKEWINKYFPDMFSEIYFSYNSYIKSGSGKTKADICKELNVDFLIDDSLEYAKECSEKGVKVLLLDQPWNQCEELPKNIIRVNNWKEVLKNI